MIVLRRLCTFALAALVLLESAGVARAFGNASVIDCCCGVHSSARGCHCKECPVKLRRARVDLGAAQLAPARECAGGTDDPGVLAVIATVPAPPLLLAPATPERPTVPIPRRLHPRFVSPVRPPP